MTAAGDSFTQADCAAYVSLPLVGSATKLVLGEDLLMAAGVDYKSYLKLIGGVLLLWIGIKLVQGEEEHGDGVKAESSLWGAIRTIIIADAVMSLDNAIAIAAAGRPRRRVTTALAFQHAALEDALDVIRLATLLLDMAQDGVVLATHSIS